MIGTSRRCASGLTRGTLSAALVLDICLRGAQAPPVRESDISQPSCGRADESAASTLMVDSVRGRLRE
jgi:hypothetical protein